MRHASKKTIIEALWLVDNFIALMVIDLVKENKKISTEWSEYITALVHNCHNNHTKVKQRKLDTLRRWLTNGAKVKVYEVRANYGYGPEVLTTEATYPEAKAQKKCYDENEPGTRHWVCATYESLIY